MVMQHFTKEFPPILKHERIEQDLGYRSINTQEDIQCEEALLEAFEK